MKTGSYNRCRKFKLGDILAAVSERMGADIELPASASDDGSGSGLDQSGTQSTCRTTGRDGSRLRYPGV